MNTLLFLLALICVSAQVNLKLNLDASGSYGIAVNGNKWLQSGIQGFRANSKWYTTNQTLTLKSKTTSTGSDQLGQYTMNLLVWTSGQLSWYTSIRDYTAHSPILVFTQTFPSALNGTATGSNTDVISAFPSFKLDQSNLHYLSYHDTFLSPHIGKWGTGTIYPSGATGGVPLVLYDSNLNSVVISPLNNFMVGIHALSKNFPNTMACGLQGKILSIPAGFSHSTIVVGSTGVNNAVNYWGSLLLGFYGKAPTKVEDDFTIKNLGYWTDNGAYYYYNTEKGKNYADTMVDVYNHIGSINLPFQYYQFDSWWYFKGTTQGLVLWEPRPDIFPNGMKDVQTKMGGKPLVLHNRWFEPDNYYFKTLGYPFINEAQYSLPLDEKPFMYLMAKAKQWGMIVYEQDWLVDQFLKMEATQNNVYNAHNWMINMDKAANQNGLKIQLCMPLPNHVLQTVLMKQVTQIRASGDYQRNKYIQWAISYSSLVHHSLGVFPFKDDFWTTNATETDCTNGPLPCVEPVPELQALVSAMSAGPVAPSDKIGMFNSVNIMATCRADGVLLKPDVPSTPLDIIFKSTFADSKFLYDTLSHSYSTHQLSFNLEGSKIKQASKISWHYLLAANTDRYYTLSPSDLLNNNGADSGNYIVFDYFAGAYNTANPFNNDNPILVPELPHKGTDANYLYYVIAPDLSINGRGYSLLGETSKFITASSQRITGIDVSSDGNTVTLTVDYVGITQEHIVFEVLNSASTMVEKYECVLPDDASSGQLVCIDDGNKEPSCGCVF